MKKVNFLKQLACFCLGCLPAANSYAIDVSGTINVNGVNRIFIIHAPGTSIDVNLPVVLIFHGDGGTAAGMKNTTYGFDAVADANNFMAVYCQSTNDIGPGEWNKIADGDETGAPQDVLYISNLIDYLCSTYYINRKRVYATGMSGGAFFAYRLAIELAHKIAAIAPVSGSLWGPEDPPNTFLDDYP
ncbi:MAG: hypothetical protein LBE82_13980, partial [Chitinophagaceae bacterium]|nr:hypothetical protein [Chitinophagaceae bacterium]